MEIKKHSYLKVFFLAFICFAVVVIPIVIYNKGYFTYYGDFNSQQIPFYYHAHNAIRNGNFLWDWGTDLGSDFLTSYSFYLMGSPFFWITVMFPDSIVLYLMPWLLCLKYATAALTAYAYVRRFTKTDGAAVIGGFLYAFSGFQMFNIFFNHFHDVTAFFPLMLIAMEENITKNRKGFFAVIVAFMAVLNYFFFTGQVVFLIIYFIIRCCCNDFKVTPKKFFLLLAEALFGTGMAAVVLIPSALAIVNNYRVSEYLYGTNIIAYPESTRIWRIVQSFFMIPDLPARPNLFSNSGGKWSSIGGYLPMFSMIGVISFLKSKPDKWQSRLIKICMICAFIPVLNSAFYMFNASFYARWYYMPVLIMALVTAQVFERSDISPKPGIKGCIIFFASILIISVLPSKKDDVVTWFSFGEDKVSLYVFTGITIALFIAAVVLFRLRKKNKPFMKLGIILTVLSSFICTATVFYFGIADGPYPHQFIDTAIKGGDKITLEDTDEFFRVDISEDFDNYPMLWGYPSMRCFQSVVSTSIMEFYDAAGIQRDVASRPETSYYSLRGLFSVKYYFNKLDENGIEENKFDIPGFKLIGEQNSFNVYENEHYIPMGFTYDYYMTQDNFRTLSSNSKVGALLKAIVLDDEQVQKYSHLLMNADDIPASNFSNESYLKNCDSLREAACYDFSYSTHGFTAKINTSSDNLVFFSVPYDKGFTAFVNGNETEIEKVSNGFMAVRVPEGESTISFDYITYGLTTGIRVSAACMSSFLAYIALCFIGRMKTRRLNRMLQEASEEIIPDEKISKLITDNIFNIDISFVEQDNIKYQYFDTIKQVVTDYDAVQGSNNTEE